MSIQDIGVAIAILSALGGVLIQLVKVITNQIVDAKFKEFNADINGKIKDIYKEFKDIETEFDKQSDRSGRIERRLAVVEMQVAKKTDTFSRPD